jgi:hypothetical protein
MKSLLFGILLFSMFVLMFVSQTLYISHQEENIIFDIYNFTENNLNWNYTQHSEVIRQNITEQTNFDYNKIQSERISNIIYKTIDWFGYCIFEISKWSMEFGYNNPQYNFGYMMNFVKYGLFIILFIVLFPTLIQLSALVYLLFVFIRNMIIKIKNKQKVKENDK